MSKTALAVLVAALAAPAAGIDAVIGRPAVVPAASGASLETRTTLRSARSADFAGNLSLQMGGLAPGSLRPIAVQLQWMLREQADAGIPRGQALAVHHALVRALRDPKVSSAIQRNLQQMAIAAERAPAREAAAKLAVLADAAEREQWAMQLKHYAGELQKVLAASEAGDEGAFPRFFDALPPYQRVRRGLGAPDVAADAGSSDEATIDVPPAERGARAPESPPKAFVAQAVARRSPGQAPPHAIARYRELAAYEKWAHETLREQLHGAQRKRKALEAKYPSIAYHTAGPLSRFWMRLTGRAPTTTQD